MESDMPHGIYPPEDAAEFFAASAGEKYRPSNGTEGMIFAASFCDKCARDVNRDCPIRGASYCYDVSEPEYPSEWQYGKDGQPTCTAYTPPNAALSSRGTEDDQNRDGVSPRSA